MAESSGEPWRVIATRKQAQREARIPAEWRLKERPADTRVNVLDVPKTCGILSSAELAITESRDATELLEKLMNGRIKSVDVVRAFCKRAAIAQQVTNCLTEIFFDEALSRAKELDDHFARTGRPLGPLHGLPISLKDTFQVRGYDTTAGIAALCFRPSDSNSALVDLLLKAGAVLYCKTNIPLTLMALDSHNNVFGRTLNPLDRRLTAGGSSGGEGALMAMRGSLLGIGTDVGGSIRIPAMCNNLYGIKPSHGLVPYAGQQSGSPPGSEHIGIRASAGPLAHSIRDCKLLLRVVNEMRGWETDPEVIPRPWVIVTPQKRPLRVGIVRTDGVTAPLPAVERFLSECVRRLQSGGAVEVVELQITPLMRQCQTLANKLFSVDGNNAVFDTIEASGEPLSPWLVSRLRRKPRASHETIRDLHAQRNKLQTDFLKIWQSEGGYWGHSQAKPGERLDVLITPVAPHPLPPIDRWNTASYTSSLVLLDYPAGTLPVRTVTEADIVPEIDTATAPLSGWDKVNRTLWTNVDRRLYLGTPQCLQVVAPRWHDAELVEAMSVLDSALRSEDKRTSAKL